MADSSGVALCFFLLLALVQLEECTSRAFMFPRYGAKAVDNHERLHEVAKEVKSAERSQVLDHIKEEVQRSRRMPESSISVDDASATPTDDMDHRCIRGRSLNCVCADLPPDESGAGWGELSGPVVYWVPYFDVQMLRVHTVMRITGRTLNIVDFTTDYVCWGDAVVYPLRPKLQNKITYSIWLRFQHGKFVVKLAMWAIWVHGQSKYKTKYTQNMSLNPF